MTVGGEDGKTLGVKYDPPPATAIIREQFKHVKHTIMQNYIVYGDVLKVKQWDLSEWVGGPTGTYAFDVHTLTSVLSLNLFF